jgi:hypothetical protein
MVRSKNMGYSDVCLLRGDNDLTEKRLYRQMAHYIWQAGTRPLATLEIDDVKYSAETALVQLNDYSGALRGLENELGQQFKPVQIVLAKTERHIAAGMPAQGDLSTLDYLRTKFDGKCTLVAPALYFILKHAYRDDPLRQPFIIHCWGIHTAVGIVRLQDRFLESVLCPSSYWQGVIARHGNSLPVLNRFRINKAVLYGGFCEYLANSCGMKLVPQIDGLNSLGFCIPANAQLSEIRRGIDEVCRMDGLLVDEQIEESALKNINVVNT